MAKTSRTEISGLITELVRTHRVGQAVADCLEQQNAARVRQASIEDLDARRFRDRAEYALHTSRSAEASGPPMGAARLH